MDSSFDAPQWETRPSFSAEAERVTSLLPKPVATRLCLGAFGLFVALLGAYATRLIVISSATDKGVFCVGLAFLGSIAIFLIFPHNISLDKRYGFPVVGLGGPMVLFVTLLMLFEQKIPDPSEATWSIPQIQGTDVHLFTAQGEKFRSAFQVKDENGKEQLRIDPLDDTAFKEIPRQAEHAEDEQRVYLKSAAGTYLGFVPSGAVDRLDIATELRLGIYFGRCLQARADGKCGRRRDGRKAHGFLVSALAKGGSDKGDELVDAVDTLYFLMPRWSSNCSHFVTLAEALKGEYPRGPNRWHMLAETYLALSREPESGLAIEGQTEARKAALSYFLRFVGHDGGSPNLRQTSFERIPELLSSIPKDQEALTFRVRRTLEDLGGAYTGLWTDYAREISVDVSCPQPRVQ